MIDVLKLLDSVIRLTTPKLVAATFAAGAILFVPTPALEALRLTFLRDTYGVWVGGTFLASSSLLAATFLWWVCGHACTWLALRRLQRQREAELRRLTPEELGFLKPFVVSDETTRYAEAGDGVVAGLVKKGIVYCPSRLSIEHDVFAHNISSWAKDGLRRSRLHLEQVPVYPQEDLLEAF